MNSSEPASAILYLAGPTPLAVMASGRLLMRCADPCAVRA
uniref:Uncharacterized protein n=1 Tax=uncultured bacterium esnapd26 TaxID=1366607 RepID=S5TND3_9BACT|nr:hypothetical protein [uncultured bacterium esnapd26]